MLAALVDDNDVILCDFDDSLIWFYAELPAFRGAAEIFKRRLSTILD
jgi:hypothetical protein